MQKIEAHSAIAHAAYHDLLRLLQDDSVSAILGKPHRVERNGRGYWYDLHRIGSSVKNRYLGEDSPEMAARMAQHQTLAAQAAARATERTRLIRVLRSEGLPSIDRENGGLIAAMERMGVFRLGGTLVGTIAFRLYEASLGVRFPAIEMIQTGDIDIAAFERLTIALDDRIEGDIAATFSALDFDPLPSLDNRAVWRWRQNRSRTMVEFLTPSFREDEDIRELPALGVAAQSLHFLNYLLADPIKAAMLYRSGVLVQIPRPEAFAIYKLIVADRRQGGPDAIKAVKDRAQAAFLIRILAEDRPEELAEAYQDAVSRGPEWKRRIDSSLKRMPETAERLAELQ